MSMISVHQCIMNPYLLVFYCRINFYWEIITEKAKTTSNDCKLNLATWIKYLDILLIRT